MTPRLRTIIIGAAIVVVLGGGVALLALMPQPGNIDGSETDTSVSAEKVTLIEEAEEDVLNVVFTPREGARYTISRDPSDGTLAMTSEGNHIFPFSSADYSITFNVAILITNAVLVSENAGDEQIAQFELDKPFMTFRVNLADGSYIEMETGMESALNSGRYVRETGTNKVYILSTYSSDKLSKSADDFNSYAFLPSYITAASDENPTYNAFASVTLKREGETLSVEHEAGTDKEFRLVQPYESAANVYTLADEFLIPITNIKPSELAELHPSDLSKYGLDNPVRLEITDSEGWSGTLLVGGYDYDTESRYVMIDGIDAVLRDESDAYLFLEITVSRMRTGLTWAYNIASVSSVDFSMKGETRRVEYEHRGDNTLSARLDGIEMTEANARRLYSSMLSVIVNGDTEAEIPDKAPDYVFTITFVDGTNESMELYELNDRQYLLVYNGESLNAFTYKTTLQEKLLTKFEMLEKGEDLPMF